MDATSSGQIEADIACARLHDLNIQLHALLLRIADHGTVSRLLERLQASHVRFQYRMILAPGRAVHSVQEHRTMVDAVAAHDEEAAEAAVRLHLEHAAVALRESRKLASRCLAPMQGIS